MNTPSPLVPQGAFQDKGKNHVRITVFAILAVHVVLLGVLLIAGCNKKAATDTADSTPSIPPAPTDQWPTQPPANPVNPANPANPGNPPSNDVVIPPPPPGVGGTGTVGTPTTTDTGSNLTPAPGGTVTPGGITPPGATGTPGGGMLKDYTIAKGDTLATIGKKYGVGYKAIEAANPGINATRLKIGDKIKIPEKSSSTSTTASPTAATDPSGATIYVVKSGDNLSKISKATGVPVKVLRAANHLKMDQIRRAWRSFKISWAEA